VTTIVDFNNLAAAQVGVPYVFGGTGLAGSANPGLDCSGLPYAVALALGVTIPRTSEDQFAWLEGVPGPLRQGDLVFYYVPTDDQPQPAHEAIWWSPAIVLQAPRTGTVVGFTPMLPYSIMGYRRLPFPDAPAPPTPPEENEMQLYAADSKGTGYVIAADLSTKTGMPDAADAQALLKTGLYTVVTLTDALIASIPNA
jgi:NlpC/P60 family